MKRENLDPFAKECLICPKCWAKEERREKEIDIRNHSNFVDYLSQNGFLKITRKREFKRYWNAPPDVIRISDGKPFEVKTLRRPETKSNQLIYAIGQALTFRCAYVNSGIIYPTEIQSLVLKKNKELGNPFGKYSIEVLFL